MEDIVDTTVLDYQPPADPPPKQDIQIEQVFGKYPMVTAIPTYTPRFFRDAVAFNTSSNTFYYYDFTNNAWRTVGSGTNGFELKIIDDSTTLTTGEDKHKCCIPAHMNGLNLTIAHAFVGTAPSVSLPSIGIRNQTDGVEMLTTNITIDVGEYTSYTAATPPVIDTAHDDVATGDIIVVDVDAAGSGTQGLGVILIFA